jgi:N-glycosidase YbiA
MELYIMPDFKDFNEYNEKTDKPIQSFSGKWRFLSNFYKSEVKFARKVYPTVEHAYQAAKTLDKSERVMIQRAKTPAEAKRLGQTVTKRKDWDKKKLAIMEKLLRQKFGTCRDEKFMLIQTSPRDIIEGNTWGDVFWGVCDGEGENYLGRLLMKIRDEDWDYVI